MCKSCSYEEGDYVIEDTKIFQYNKLLVTLSSVANDEDYAFIADHGNLHLVDTKKD